MMIHRSRVCFAPPRVGATLSEVLASLIVMSIGVVSVATLFPISVLRTVQANQLTTSAQLKYDFDGLTGPRPEITTGAGVWQANRPYDVGDLVISSVGNNRFFERNTAGISGATEPQWKFATQATTDDGATANAWITHRARVFMVDPLGWEERSQEMRDRGLAPAVNTVDIRNTFGRLDMAAPQPTTFLMDSPYRLVRFRGGVALSLAINANPPNPSSSTFFPAVNSNAAVASRKGAFQTCALQDSWLQQVNTIDLVAGGLTPASIQVANTSLIQTLDQNQDNTVDFRFQVGYEQGVTGRVVLFGQDSRSSVVRQIATITQSGAAEQISWQATQPIPAGFTPIRVRVETFEPRFTWMLAARRQVSGALYMDLITFFKRSYDPNHELIHPANFLAGHWPGLDGTPGTLDDVFAAVVVQYNTALGTGTPALRKGGFICDAQNNRWYRILNFKEVPQAQDALNQLNGVAAGTPGPLQQTRGAVVTLEYTALESSGVYTAGDANATGGALILPGIVNVYPLQPVLPWEN